MQNKQFTHRSHRRGSAIVMTIIALLITTAICMSLTKTLTLRHARHEQQFWKHQAELLSQSALDRAVQQLKQSPDYTGETWSVTFNSQLVETGVSVIKVENDPNQNIRIINIITHVPANDVHRSQSSLTAKVEMP